MNLRRKTILDFFMLEELTNETIINEMLSDIVKLKDKENPLLFREYDFDITYVEMDIENDVVYVGDLTSENDDSIITFTISDFEDFLFDQKKRI